MEVSTPTGDVITIDLEAGPQPHAWGEFAILGEIVKLLRPRIAVEVGVMYAWTTVWLARFLPPDGVIYGLDINPDWSEPLLKAWAGTERWAEVARKVHIVGGESRATIPTLPDGIGFAFVDGDHAYASVSSDTDILWPKMAEGGLLAFHDCGESLEWACVRDFVRSRFPQAIRFDGGNGLALVQKRS